MSALFIILALASIPVIFFTMFARTDKGTDLGLGSFFVIRKFKSDFLRVRNLKDIFLLALRICFAVLICLLIIDPAQVEAPSGNFIVHAPAEKSRQRNMEKYYIKIIAPAQARDIFDEDLFFLESFARNFKTSANAAIIYDPTDKMIPAHGDIIIFPSKKPAFSAFQRWIDDFEITQMRVKSANIKDAGTLMRAYYPILISNTAKVKKFAELDDGTVIAVLFEDNGRGVLLFGTGLSAFWGDLGVSGYFIELIDKFISGRNLSEKVDRSLKPQGIGAGRVESYLSAGFILKTACIFLIIEFLYFILRPYIKKLRKRFNFFYLAPFVFLAVSLSFIPSDLKAEDFKFIEITDGGESADSRAMFSVIKQELEDKTSIRISPDFYQIYSSASLIKGGLPEFPYIWIFGSANLRLSEDLKSALAGFIERGGIIFVDAGNGNAGRGVSYINFFKDLGYKISGRPGIVPLGSDHPVFKSFYLIYNQNLSGSDVSVTTRRTALIISESSFKERILRKDTAAIKLGVNVVLYMLSGNYKSDQIHSRHILERIKKRGLYR